MILESEVLGCIHLDSHYGLLSVHNMNTCVEYFHMLDLHLNESINDCLFWGLMNSITDLTRIESDTLFHLLDVKKIGEVDFEEFYLMFCIMIAVKDQYEKEFIYRHSNSIFKLIDSDGSGLVSKAEFSLMGLLFNFSTDTITKIFNDFDIPSDKHLDFTEFRLFSMACIEEEKNKLFKLAYEGPADFKRQMLMSMEDLLVQAVRTNILPPPDVVARNLYRVVDPHRGVLAKIKATPCGQVIWFFLSYVEWYTLIRIYKVTIDSFFFLIGYFMFVGDLLFCKGCYVCALFMDKFGQHFPPTLYSHKPSLDKETRENPTKLREYNRNLQLGTIKRRPVLTKKHHSSTIKVSKSKLSVTKKKEELGKPEKLLKTTKSQV